MTSPTDPMALADELLAFFNFINEPPQYEDKRMVRDYRHELGRLWLPLHEKITAALRRPSPQGEALDIARFMEVVRSRWNFEDHQFDCIEQVLFDPECTAALSQPPAQPKEDRGAVAWQDVAEDDPDVVLTAHAIAEHGIGRPWDDFLPTNAYDVDHGDLIEYGRAAVAALRSKAAPPLTEPASPAEDRMREALDRLPLWQHVQFGLLMGKLSDWRNADHEDNIVLCRSDVIAIIDAVNALTSHPPAGAD